MCTLKTLELSMSEEGRTSMTSLRKSIVQDRACFRIAASRHLGVAASVLKYFRKDTSSYCIL